MGGSDGGLLSYRSLVHACAGAAGGCVAMAALYPLDTVRARRQLGAAPPGSALRALATIAKAEGPCALYKGCLPLLEALCCSNFVYFYAFHGLKAYSLKRRGGAAAAAKGTPGSDLALAAAAGVVNVLLTNPLWVIVTRLRVGSKGCLEAPPYSSLASGLCHTAREQGPRGLWAGTVPSLVLVCNPALQFACYEALKRRAIAPGRAPSPLQAFTLGAMAKAFATLLTYPLQLLQTRMRHGGHERNVGGSGGAQKKRGLWGELLRVLQEDGIAGLFKGLEAKLLQTVLTAALMFALYERIAAFVFAVLMANQRKRLAH